jgi:nucleotide-binding universal stress UspA family protein
MMFRSLVVPVAFDPCSDRALSVAGTLVRAGGMPLELVTVSATAQAATADRRRLHRQARRLAKGLTTCTVLHGPNPAEAIGELLDHRPDSLLVLGTHARGVISECLFGSVSGSILADTTLPVLMIGPHVGFPPDLPATVVVGVTSSVGASTVLPVLLRWTRSFGVRQLWLVEVGDGRPSSERAGVDQPPSDAVAELLHGLASDGIHAHFDIECGYSPERGLLRVAGDVGAGVVVVASGRWTDASCPHLHSTARDLVSRSPWPVLVVRAQPPWARARLAATASQRRR